MPAVSVVIPTKDRALLLRETLASLHAQTTRDWEAVVVDDASADDTPDVAREGGVAYLRLPEGTSGASAARNLGVARTTGRYVVFLDSDDLLAADALEGRIAELDARPQVDFVVSQCGLFRKTFGDTPLAWNTLGPAGTDLNDRDLDRYLARDPVWQTTGPTWRREALTRVGPWDEHALSGQDWEFATRALACGLRHEVLPGRVDCGWRMPSGSRETIGKAAAVGTTASAYARSWAGTVERVWRAVEAAGRMNPDRRRLVAALMWHACRTLGDKASYAEAGDFWRRVRGMGLISRRLELEGRMFHRSGRVAWFNAVKQRHVETCWPAEFRRAFRGSRSHCRVRLDAASAPLVSVLLPARDAEMYVEQAVRSVLAQTFRDFELLVLDDGSIDATADVLTRVADDDVRVTLIRRPRGRAEGLVKSLNELARHARGRLIARMDADDVCHPERFEKQVDLLAAEPDVGLVGGQVRWVDPLGQPYATSRLPTTHDGIVADLLAGRGGTLPHPAAMFRREVFDAAGGYRDWAFPSEDLDLWLRLTEHTRAANVDEVVLDYRQHFGSITRTRRSEQLRIKPRIVAEAYARRGLGDLRVATLDPWRPEPAGRLLREWGWRALRDGRLSAARSHATDLLRRQPSNLDAWRLFAAAVRGH